MKNRYSTFNILFVYPNIEMRTIIPPGIALMSAILKESGFNVDVFDAETKFEEDCNSKWLLGCW